MQEKTGDSPKTMEEVWKRAFDDMCKALDKFGVSQVLRLLVIHSRNDIVVHQLLTRFPVVVATGEFLHTLPTLKVNRRTFKRLERRGCII